MKYAICNEMFEGWTHEGVASAVAGLGYEGIEIAPFTLGPAPNDLSKSERDNIRTAFENPGLKIIGIHWLLKGAGDVSITTPDDDKLNRTADYVRGLVGLCHDLGGTIMVFGSPKQRMIEPGQEPADAHARAVRLFKEVAPVAEEAGVTICFEPLTNQETNFINTCADGVKLVQEVNHPALKLHLDVKAMCGAETDPPAEIIKKEGGRHLRHFHANDPNLLGPGMGDVDFAPVAKALESIDYSHWISVETFAPGPGPEETARRSMETMRNAFDNK